MQKRKSRADANDHAVGQRIFAFRKSLGLSQSELGELVGVSYQQVQKYEKGKDRCSVSLLMRFSGALDVSLRDLLPASSLEGRPLLAEPDRATLELIRAFTAIKDEGAKRSILGIVKSLSRRE